MSRLRSGVLRVYTNNKKRTFMSLAKTLLMLSLSLGVLFIAVASAQVRSATITGSVSDQSGAAVPNAEVVITDFGTNVFYKTKTTAAGQFTMPYLEAGTYTVDVTGAGFTRWTETGLIVATHQTVRVAVSLKTGGVESLVEVTAQAIQIQTDSTEVTNATTSAAINDIPNVTQNPQFYAMLQNGVQPRNETSNGTSLGSFGIGVAGRAEFSAIGVNGRRVLMASIDLTLSGGVITFLGQQTPKPGDIIQAWYRY
jgi:hypothetical protein